MISIEELRDHSEYVYHLQQIFNIYELTFCKTEIQQKHFKMLYNELRRLRTEVDAHAMEASHHFPYPSLRGPPLGLRPTEFTHSGKFHAGGYWSDFGKGFKQAFLPNFGRVLKAGLPLVLGATGEFGSAGRFNHRSKPKRHCIRHYPRRHTYFSAAGSEADNDDDDDNGMGTPMTSAASMGSSRAPSTIINEDMGGGMSRVPSGFSGTWDEIPFAPAMSRTVSWDSMNSYPSTENANFQRPRAAVSAADTATDSEPLLGWEQSLIQQYNVSRNPEERQLLLENIAAARALRSAAGSSFVVNGPGAAGLFNHGSFMGIHF